MTLRSLMLSAALGLAAAPALALEEAECRYQEQIARAVVEARLAGFGKRAAERRVRARLGERADQYAVALSALVEDVYGRPKGDLGDAYAQALYDACMAYKP